MFLRVSDAYFITMMSCALVAHGQTQLSQNTDAERMAAYCAKHPTSFYGVPGTASGVSCSDWARQNPSKLDFAKPLAAASMDSGVSSGKLIHRVEPEYPRKAKDAHIEGTVVLHATIAKDGTISELLTISGPKELIPAAVRAVEQWRYQPYLLDGQPVAVETDIRVHFELPSPDFEAYCKSFYGGLETFAGVNCSDWAQNRYFKSAALRVMKSDFDGAIADFTKAIDLTPDDWVAYFGRGDAKRHKSDFDGAIADYTKAIGLKPSYSVVYTGRGIAKYSKSDFDGAIADYTNAIGLTSYDWVAYFGRGCAKNAKDDFDGAIADYTKAIGLKPSYQHAYLFRGNAKYAKSDFDGAIADYTNAIGLTSYDWVAYFGRGGAKYAKSDFDGAIADFTKAIQLNPIYGAAYYARSRARRAKGDESGADADEASAKRLGYSLQN